MTFAIIFILYMVSIVVSRMILYLYEGQGGPKVSYSFNLTGSLMFFSVLLGLIAFSGVILLGFSYLIDRALLSKLCGDSFKILGTVMKVSSQSFMFWGLIGIFVGSGIGVGIKLSNMNRPIRAFLFGITIAFFIPFAIPLMMVKTSAKCKDPAETTNASKPTYDVAIAPSSSQGEAPSPAPAPVAVPGPVPPTNPGRTTTQSPAISGPRVMTRQPHGNSASPPTSSSQMRPQYGEMLPSMAETEPSMTSDQSACSVNSNETLNEYLIVPVMKSMKPAVLGCMDKYKESGKVKLRVTVNCDGSILEVTGTGDDGVTQAVPCIEKVLKGARFPPFRSPQQKSFVYPYSNI